MIDSQVKLYGKTPNPVTEAIRICKDRDLLKLYLTEHETEVTDIMITLFDQETVTRSYMKETFEKGREEERKAEKRENARSFLAEAVPEGAIANALKLPLSEVTALKAQVAQ